MLGAQNIVNLSGNATVGTTSANWTCKQISAWTSLTGTSYIGGNLSLSFLGSNVGANGMDVGPFPPALSDLYIYAIYDSGTSTWGTLGTIAGSGAPIYGGSNMPSGYTASALIWSGKVANGAFIGFEQVGNLINIVSGGNLWATVLIPENLGEYTSLSIANAVPVNSKSVLFNQVTSGFNGISLFVAMDAIGTGAIMTSNLSVDALFDFLIVPNYFEISLSTAATIYYKFITPSSDAQLNVLGWRI